MFLKISCLKNHSSQWPNNTVQKQTGQRKYCTFCEKEGHTEVKCYTLEKTDKKLKLAKARISEIQQNFNEHSTNQKKLTKKLI
jgi:hypothetical protein